MAAFITGVSLSAVFLLSWLASIIYLRRTRARMRTESAQPRQEDLARTGELTHSIEAWLARAAALPDGRKPAHAAEAPRDQAKLEELAARHFPHISVPHPHLHLHLFGLTEVEKRLLAWVSQNTGLPDPFDALDDLTGDPDRLRVAAQAWQAAHADIVALVNRLSAASAGLHADWASPDAEKFFAILADYLAELDALAEDVATTAEALRGLQAEAALAEGTIAGLVNLLIGSFGGYLVETVLTVGTMTPAVAAQAQVELTWVVKQVAVALSRLQSIYANTRRILQSVTGFKGLDQMPARFQIDEVDNIERSIDSIA